MKNGGQMGEGIFHTPIKKFKLPPSKIGPPHPPNQIWEFGDYFVSYFFQKPLAGHLT